MKTLYFTLLAFFATAMIGQAQVNTPAASPSAKVEQTVGLTDITIEYSRPSMKGRTLWGDLVPYDAFWRTGANAATKFTFSTDVMIGGQKLTAGSYALLTKPGMKSWELYFFPYKSGSWSSYRDTEDQPVIVTTEMLGSLEVPVESFMIALDELRNGSATLLIVWGQLVVATEIEVPTDEAVMASIESTMSGPSAGDYRAAAGYYLEEGKDLDKALMWINKSMEMGGERFWILQDKSEIQAGLGDYDGAIKTAMKSKELAKEAGNNDYLKINDKNIAKWKEM